MFGGTYASFWRGRTLFNFNEGSCIGMVEWHFSWKLKQPIYYDMILITVIFVGEFCWGHFCVFPKMAIVFEVFDFLVGGR